MPISAGGTPPQSGLTLAQLRTRVRNLSDTDSTEVSDTEVDEAINNAYRDMTADYPWPWLLDRASLPVVAGTDEYDVVGAIAADMEAHRIRSVTMDNRKLRYVSPQGYFLLNPQGGQESRGGPSHYTVIGDNFVLWPNPSANSTAQIAFYRLPADLTSSDKPLMPARYHHILVIGALPWILDKLDMCEKADRYRAEFAQRLEGMRADLTSAEFDSMWSWGEDEEVYSMAPRFKFPWE